MRRDPFTMVIEKTENVEIVALGRSRRDDCNGGAWWNQLLLWWKGQFGTVQYVECLGDMGARC
jgi:hypothetical protein